MLWVAPQIKTFSGDIAFRRGAGPGRKGEIRSGVESTPGVGAFSSSSRRRWLNPVRALRCLNHLHHEGWLETRLAPLNHQHRDASWQFTLFRNFENAGYTLSARLQQNSDAKRQLTPRETEIMHWVAQGKTNDEIALILELSLNTVKTHLKRIFIKTGVENRTAASLAWKPDRPAL